jgi:2-polyprenyl-3-methyl-5-hydroxy-6-metoxy-1,4-benzoquinol methylase
MDFDKWEDYFELIEWSDFGWGESELACFKHRNEIIYDYFRSSIHRISQCTLLDLGSGEGNLANLLSRIFLNVICVDANEKSILKGQLKFPHIKYYHSKMSEIPDVKYDIIIIIGAVFYCSSNEIEELCKRISERKRVIVSNLSDTNLEIFKSNGFQIESIYTYFRPRHKLSLLNQLLIRYYLLETIKRHKHDKQISYLINRSSYNHWISFLVNRVPFLLYVSRPIILIIRKIAQSQIIYKLLFLFGKEKQILYTLIK